MTCGTPTSYVQTTVPTSAEVSAGLNPSSALSRCHLGQPARKAPVPPELLLPLPLELPALVEVPELVVDLPPELPPDVEPLVDVPPVEPMLPLEPALPVLAPLDPPPPLAPEAVVPFPPVGPAEVEPCPPLEPPFTLLPTNSQRPFWQSKPLQQSGVMLQVCPELWQTVLPDVVPWDVAPGQALESAKADKTSSGFQGVMEAPDAHPRAGGWTMSNAKHAGAFVSRPEVPIDVATAPAAYCLQLASERRKESRHADLDHPRSRRDSGQFGVQRLRWRDALKGRS
jgi:hypothetical protein